MGNCPGGTCPSGELSWRGSDLVGIVLMGNHPGGELSGGELSWWEVVLVRNCPGGEVTWAPFHKIYH